MKHQFQCKGTATESSSHGQRGDLTDGKGQSHDKSPISWDDTVHLPIFNGESVQRLEPCCDMLMVASAGGQLHLCQMEISKECMFSFLVMLQKSSTGIKYVGIHTSQTADVCPGKEFWSAYKQKSVVYLDIQVQIDLKGF